jgi:DNA-binding Lrp family transcriptional regulator
MDKLDYLILTELLKDGAMSFVDISKNVNSTPCTVRRRYEKMKKAGKIFQCIVSLNLSRLGYQGKTFLLLTLMPNSNKSETVAYLKNIRNILVVTEIIGPCDIMAIAPITDLTSIQTLLTETKKAPNIQKVDFYCINDTSFPIGHNFGEVLNQRCQILSEKL